jgi:hypothetical protein
MAAYQRQSPPTFTPSAIDMAWAAGFLEGEGSFCPMSGKDTRARMSASQKTKEPLEKLLGMFGGRIYYIIKPDIYVWMLRGEMARNLLPKLYPLMSVRRQVQIDKTLNAKFSVDYDSKERFAQKAMVKGFLGKKHSEDTKNKIRQSRLAYWDRRRSMAIGGVT